MREADAPPVMFLGTKYLVYCFDDVDFIGEIGLPVWDMQSVSCFSRIDNTKRRHFLRDHRIAVRGPHPEFFCEGGLKVRFECAV